MLWFRMRCLDECGVVGRLAALASSRVQLGAPPGSMPSASWRSDPPSKLHCWVGLSCRNAEPCGFTFYTATETVARPGGTVLLGGSLRSPPAEYNSALRPAPCRVQVGGPIHHPSSTAGLGLVAGMPNPAGSLFTRRPRRSRAQGAPCFWEARCARLLPSTTWRSAQPPAECKSVLFGRLAALASCRVQLGAPPGLQPSTTRRSARLHAKCNLALRPVRVRC